MNLSRLATKGVNGMKAAYALGRIDANQEPDYFDALLADLERRQREDRERDAEQCEIDTHLEAGTVGYDND